VEIKSKGEAAGSLNICLRRSFFSSERAVNLNEDEQKNFESVLGVR
jgi:hypothetical protein